MPGGILQGSVSGEAFQPNADFWSDGAYNADIDAAADQAAGEAFLGDLAGGASIGSAGGFVGGIIGMAVGLVMGLIDADVTKGAARAALEEEQQRRAALEEELKDVMNMRDEIEQNLSALLHPLEQQFRTRARLFGAQARAQGLTGAQSIASQVLAEEQYRQVVGPALPGLLREARGLAREQAFGRLKEIETREGILLNQQRLQLQTDLAAAQSRASLLEGLSQTAIGAGVAIGQGIEDAQGNRAADSGPASPTGLQTDPINDIYGPDSNLPDNAGGGDAFDPNAPPSDNAVV